MKVFFSDIHDIIDHMDLVIWEIRQRYHNPDKREIILAVERLIGELESIVNNE